MQVRILERPELVLAGYATRLPLTGEPDNPHMEEFVADVPVEQQRRLAGLSNTEPAGLLQVTADPAPGGPDGSGVTYMLAAAVTEGTAVPEDLKTVRVAGGSWAVVTSQGPHPRALQEAWAAAEGDWLPSQPWQRRPGPTVVAVLERDEDFTVATCELWLPVEPG